MGKDRLNLEETREMFIVVAKGMLESKDILTKADQTIGDGDHGIGMARGFEAVVDKLSKSEFNTIRELLNAIGMTLLTSVGGAAGAIFGTLFRGAAKSLDEAAIFDSQALSTMLLDGLLAVKLRGKAEPGDKTMIDALEPAAKKARQLVGRPLNEVIVEVSEEARKGVEKTKGMIAKFGKAKALGERSRGHPDPGAISMHFILKFMAAFLK